LPSHPAIRRATATGAAPPTCPNPTSRRSARAPSANVPDPPAAPVKPYFFRSRLSPPTSALRWRPSRRRTRFLQHQQHHTLRLRRLSSSTTSSSPGPLRRGRRRCWCGTSRRRSRRTCSPASSPTTGPRPCAPVPVESTYLIPVTCLIALCLACSACQISCSSL